MSIQQLEKKLSDILKDHPGIDLVYLFGSQVSGHVGPMSDFDVGILIDHEEIKIAQDKEQIRLQLAHNLAKVLCTNRVDVVVLNDAPIELQRAATAQGKLLHERDAATRVEYEAYVMSVYGDYLPVLRAQREDILRGGDRVPRSQRYRAALGRTRRALGKITSTQRDSPGRV
jgi:predicted nucleotidyltransferase